MTSTAPFIPADVLLDGSRIVRRSVPAWATDLTNWLRDDPGKDVPALMGCFNNASLIFAIAGDGSVAREICDRQLLFLKELIPKYGMTEMASLAVQPWVNVGRLHRQRGEVEEAIRRFQSIYSVDPSGEVQFGGFSLRGRDSAYENLELIYAFDVLRTLCQANKLDEAMRLIQRTRRSISPLTKQITTEFEFQILARLGRISALPRVLESPEWTVDRHSALTNALYRCIVLQASEIDCRQILGDLCDETCRNLTKEAPLDHREVRYALELTRFTMSLDMAEPAERLARAGYQASMLLGDVIFLFEFSTLLATLRANVATSTPAEILAASCHLTYARRKGVIFEIGEEGIASLHALRLLVDLRLP